LVKVNGGSADAELSRRALTFDKRTDRALDWHTIKQASDPARYTNVVLA